ncbi:MAG: glycosyltransferase [Acidimicrobiales bacterium]
MPFALSVIVTARDEPVRRIERLLQAVAEQDVDGAVQVLIAVPPEERGRFAHLHPTGSVAEVLIVDNPAGGRSSGLNRAARASSAPIVCRLDARTLPPPDYLRRCALRLGSDPAVGMVGGTQCPRPSGSSTLGVGIARALANPWLLGAAAYRRPGASGPVDTVYLGAFRRNQLFALGGWEERLDANEDFDLATRYREAGWLVWLEEGLEVGYEPRGSLRSVYRQYNAFGQWKVRFWRMRGARPNGRQLLALGLAGATIPSFVLAAASSLWLGIAAVELLAMALCALDHAGGRSQTRFGVRTAAVAASVAVVAGWLSGIAWGALRSVALPHGGATHASRRSPSAGRARPAPPGSGPLGRAA